MNIIVSFAEIMRSYRKSMGWTQNELATRWSYSFETVSAWERSKRRPATQEIPRLAKLLEMDPEELADAIDYHRESSKVRKHSGAPQQHEHQQTYDTWRELQRIYRSRTDFNRDFSYMRIFEHASHVIAAGISLNAIALNYSRDQMIDSVVNDGRHYQLCFLDPRGNKCAERESEEGYPPGVLANLTTINIRHMQTLRSYIQQIAPERADHLQLYTYDLAPRFNIYVMDDTIMTAQHYAYARGEDTPTWVLKRQTKGGMFDFYSAAARYILEHAQDVSAASPL